VSACVQDVDESTWFFEDVLPSRALAGPAIVGAAIALAAVLVICATRTRWAAAMIVAVSLIGLSVLPARAIVLRYGADPIAPPALAA
jgi:hypothetical protein